MLEGISGSAAVLRALLAVAMVAAIFALALMPTGAARAADLGRAPVVTECDPAYFGAAPPWSTRDERPPRKGVWYFSAPLPPTVNFLVPMGDQNCFQRPAPWTPAWYAYCERRWPSFNPRTGTVVTPDGVRMCI